MEIHCEVDCTCMVGIDWSWEGQGELKPVFEGDNDYVQPYEYTFHFCPICGEELNTGE